MRSMLCLSKGPATLSDRIVVVFCKTRNIRLYRMPYVHRYDRPVAIVMRPDDCSTEVCLEYREGIAQSHIVSGSDSQGYCNKAMTASGWRRNRLASAVDHLYIKTNDESAHNACYMLTYRMSWGTRQHPAGMTSSRFRSLYKRTGHE